MTIKTLLAMVVVIGASGASLLAVPLDLGGTPHRLDSGKVTAVIFLNPDCPVCRREVATLNDLSASMKNAELLGVISDPSANRKTATQFVKDYAVAFPVVLDSSGELADRLKPDRTPEAFVLNGEGNVQYAGRIDDRFVSIGKERTVVTSHDLADALAAVSAGKGPASAKTEAVGCVFESWKSASTIKTTYTRNVAPILYANCVSCHRDGEVAPFSLLTYSDAAKRADQIEEITGKRLMPPWKAEPSFGHFMDERRLSNAEIQTIHNWANSGAAEGDPADLPPAPTFTAGWMLGPPDLVLKMPETFSIPADGPDLYRAFVMPLKNADDAYVSGIEFHAGAKSVLHHTILYLDTSGTARKLDEADPGPGYKSFGGPGFSPTGSLGGWAPGAQPYLLPAGTARLARAGSDVVMQVHYHPDGKPHEDRSEVGVYFAKQPVTQIIHGIVLISRKIDIPAGKPDYRMRAELTLPVDVTVVGATPHMHLIGKDMRVQATTPTNQLIPLIHIADWDFRWQDQYRLASPIRLAAGTKIELTARYDNSATNANNPNAPPKEVTWGEQTTDEMCICFLNVTLDRPEDYRPLRRAMAEAAMTAGEVK